ncbi:angiotensin-converting enzyme-like [Haemaphysalis longicornis]
MMSLRSLVFALWLTASSAHWEEGSTCPAEAKLAAFEVEYREMMNRLQTVHWNFATNMTPESRAARDNFQPLFNAWMWPWKKWARTFVDYSGTCPARTMELIGVMRSGVVMRDPLIAKRVSELRTAMICYSASATNAAAERYMAETTNPELLKSRWLQWSQWQNTSEVYFKSLVSMLNAAAITNGYRHYTDSWNEGLDVEKESIRLWEEVRPLYVELHAYVRGMLWRRYSNEFQPHEPIPVHLLGNLFGENWRNVADLVVPAGLRSPAARRRPPSSPLDTVREAEAYFESLGFPPMPALFWKKSLFERPSNTSSMECHATAYDFADGKDFRMKACLGGSETDRETAFHEMGHLKYFLAYRDRRSLFRTAPLAALHEAIGEAFGHAATCEADSVIHGAGKPDNGAGGRDTTERLLREALFKLVPLPWILSVEKWRYALFQGRVADGSLASSLWSYREVYQGVKPPTPKSREYFDAGGKHHVSHFIPYFRYFFARFLDYQLLKAMCSEQHPELPIFLCCVDKETTAVSRIRRMMSFGASINWQEALQMATGTPRISAGALLEYYEPLFSWLRQENIRWNNSIGW